MIANPPAQTVSPVVFGKEDKDSDVRPSNPKESQPAEPQAGDLNDVTPPTDDMEIDPRSRTASPMPDEGRWIASQDSLSSHVGDAHRVPTPTSDPDVQSLETATAPPLTDGVPSLVSLGANPGVSEPTPPVTEVFSAPGGEDASRGDMSTSSGLEAAKASSQLGSQPDGNESAPLLGAAMSPSALREAKSDKSFRGGRSTPLSESSSLTSLSSDDEAFQDLRRVSKRIQQAKLKAAETLASAALSRKRGHSEATSLSSPPVAGPSKPKRGRRDSPSPKGKSSSKKNAKRGRKGKGKQKASYDYEDAEPESEDHSDFDTAQFSAPVLPITGTTTLSDPSSSRVNAPANPAASSSSRLASRLLDGILNSTGPGTRRLRALFDGELDEPDWSKYDPRASKGPKDAYAAEEGDSGDEDDCDGIEEEEDSTSPPRRKWYEFEAARMKAGADPDCIGLAADVFCFPYQEKASANHDVLI